MCLQHFLSAGIMISCETAEMMTEQRLTICNNLTTRMIYKSDYDAFRTKRNEQI